MPPMASEDSSYGESGSRVVVKLAIIGDGRAALNLATRVHVSKSVSDIIGASYIYKKRHVTFG